MFRSTNLPLVKWFCAIYLLASDKGGISALHLSKQINVSWITTSRMLRKIRIAMGHRDDSFYRLEEVIEIDDALIGGRQTGGMRGGGAERQTPILVAVEIRGKRAGFIAIQQVSGSNRAAVSQLVKRHLSPNQRLRSDAWLSLAEIGRTQNHDARVRRHLIKLVNGHLGYMLPLAALKHFCLKHTTVYRQNTYKSI